MSGSDHTRAHVLATIRKGLGVPGDDAVRRAAVQERLGWHRSGTIPARVANEADWLPLFREKLQAQGADVSLVADEAAAVQAIVAYLRDQNLPARIRMGDDPRLAALPWDLALQIARDFGPPAPEDAVGLSHAFAAAAETGTLVLVSGADNPTSLNFLPETHIVLLEESGLAGAYETVWTRLRETYGEGRLPRTVNLISGPSRTADIEQTLIRGAHGPKRLFVLVLQRAFTTGEAEPGQFEIQTR